MTTRFADHLLGLGVHADRPAATAVPVGTLYSCSDHSLIYQSDGATWATWATLGSSGGASGGLKGAANYDSYAANATVSLTSSYAQIQAAAVVTVPAVVGDRICVTTSQHWSSASGATVYSDTAVWNPSTSAIIRRRRANYGVYFEGSKNLPGRLVDWFTVAAGDIVSGQVSFTPVARTDSSGSRLLVTQDYGLLIDAVNFGQPPA